MYQVEIIHFETPLPVLMKPHQGPYSGIASAFAALRALLQQHAEGSQTVRAFGQYLDDPATVAPQALRAAACLTPPRLCHSPLPKWKSWGLFMENWPQGAMPALCMWGRIRAWQRHGTGCCRNGCRAVASNLANGPCWMKP
jgi:hypothetical protein